MHSHKMQGEGKGKHHHVMVFVYTFIFMTWQKEAVKTLCGERAAAAAAHFNFLLSIKYGANTV